MNSKIVFFFMIMCCCSVTLFAQTNTGKKQTSTNPVFDGWYADPEGVVFGDKYWIYPTYSAPFEQQLYMDAFFFPRFGTLEKTPESPFCRKYQLVKECFMGTCRDRSKWEILFLFWSKQHIS